MAYQQLGLLQKQIETLLISNACEIKQKSTEAQEILIYKIIIIFAFCFLLSEIKSPPKDGGGGVPTSSQSESKVAAEQKPNIELKDVPAKNVPALVNVSQQPPLINRKNSDQLQSPELNKVGQSVFYDCVDLSPMAEKQDDMKPERSDTEEESELYIVT